MQRESVVACAAPRRICAFLVLALGVGAAPAAWAYNAQLTMDAASAIYFLDHSAPAASKIFDPATITTNLSVPIGVSRDTSISVGPSSGQAIVSNGSYTANVAPGGLHLSAQSMNRISYSAVAGDDRYLVAQNGGSIHAAFDDTVTFNVAGMASGTPFLVDMKLRVDGTFSVLAGQPGSPITPNAYASGTGLWGFDLLVPGGRPAGAPPTITNRFEDGAAFGARDDGSTFNQFPQFGYPKTLTVTMYATSGVASLLEMYTRLVTGAIADASTSPSASGLVEAGVQGDLSNTVAWGGISGIHKLDGTSMSLSDLTIQSSSGFDYTKAYVDPVPEPSTVWLLLIGACCLWFARGRAARNRPLTA